MSRSPDSFGPVSALRRSLRRRFLGLGKTRSAAYWDEAFATGAWEGLASDAELPRYAVLAALVRRFAPPSSPVLDVGCGTGVLARHLLTDPPLSYVGIDLSAEAVRRARAEFADAAIFIAASADDPPPHAVSLAGPFGAIVFNEVLYYLADPARTVAAWVSLLGPGGVGVISCFDPSRNAAVLRRASRGLDCCFQTDVRTGSGAPWRVSVWRRKATAPPPTT